MMKPRCSVRFLSIDTDEKHAPGNENSRKNALQVEGQGIPGVRLLFFISDGSELAMDNWRSMLISYTENARSGRYTMLDVWA
jgi:hypothetical protein